MLYKVLIILWSFLLIQQMAKKYKNDSGNLDILASPADIGTFSMMCLKQNFVSHL